MPETFDPLEGPTQRLLSAIEGFDGPSGRRSSATVRELRTAMQHLLSVAETDGGSMVETVRSLLPRQIVYATGWSTETLSAIHRDLQLLLQS